MIQPPYRYWGKKIGKPGIAVLYNKLIENIYNVTHRLKWGYELKASSVLFISKIVSDKCLT